MAIALLPPDVAIKIAAGEVVERPASVVKELLENSLDAGATAVRVEIRGGGAQLIKVTDDGCGIPEGELHLAMARHATSKILDVHDLDAVSTLGFRGEALASIAAVAETTIISRPEGQSSASYLSLRGADRLEEGRRGAPVGTSVSVRGLFREIPARLKFLRSVSAEASQISQVVCQYALAFPEVRFSLMNEDRLVFQSPGDGRLLEVVRVLYGVETAAAMRAVELDETGASPISIAGLAGDPSVHRATRGYLSFFVNRRWVRNRSLPFAIEEAYRGLLPEGRHPIAVMHVKLPPSELDVNVHPGKLEIRFLHEPYVYASLQRAVRRVLLENLSVGALVATPEPVLEPIWSPAMLLPANVGKDPAQSPRLGDGTADDQRPPLAHAGLRVLGQFGNTFIVAEGPDGMYLVDQHRAHERVLYEQMRAEQASQGIARQALLEPATLELRPGQADRLDDLLPALSEIGWLIERFGERSLLVREVPVALAGGDPLPALQAFFDEVGEREAEQKASGPEWTEAALINIACHSAIRSDQVLTQLEMHDLLARLDACAVRSLCPHQDPIMVHLSELAIRKQFGRERDT